MQPYNATIVVYAENADEIKKFQSEFYDLVNTKREQGIAVSAKKLTQAIKMFRDNQYVNNYLKM